MRLIALLLLVALPVSAKPVEVEMGWDDMRTAVNHSDFLPNARVRTGPDGSSQVKGRLGRITESGLTIVRNRRPTFFDRDEVHSVRLVPRKASTRRHRQAAAIAAPLIGAGACSGFLVLTCWTANACMEGLSSPPRLAFHVGALMIGVPYLVYRLAKRADRGSIVIVLQN